MQPDSRIEGMWLSPHYAQTIARLCYNVEASERKTLDRMPVLSVEWGSPDRGRSKGDPEVRTAKRVRFSDYLATARVVAEEARIAEEAKQASRTAAEARQGGGRNERLEALERRIEALEAAFDSLLGSVKEVA